MNSRYSEPVWEKYSANIIATNVSSAVFLATFLSYMSSSHDYASAIEVIDLQRYKLVSRQQKVRMLLRERAHKPFIFVVGKN